MRINLKQIKNVLRIDKDFARLVDIDRFGRPVYRINYFANIPNSIIRNAKIVRITAYTRNPLVRSSFFQGTTTSRGVVKNIQSRFSRRKDQIRKSRERFVGRSYGDITSGINNEIAQRILRKPDRADELVGNRTILRAVKSTQATKAKSQEHANTALSLLGNVPKVQGKSIRSSAVKSIIRHGVDPSFIGDIRFPLISSRDATQGITGSPGSRSSRIRAQKYGRQKRTRNVSPKIARMKAARARSRAHRVSKLHNPTKNLRTYYQRDRQTLPGGLSAITTNTNIIRQIIPARWKGMNQTVYIHRRAGKGSTRLYFLFELLGENGQIVFQTVREVNHERKMDEYLTPRRPPSVQVTGARLGINRLQLEQLDPLGTKIVLYRKYLNPKDASVSRRYSRIAVLELGYDDGAINYTDSVNNTMTCIYRAVAIGPRGGRSKRFKNVISRALSLPTKGGIKSSDFEHVSIFAESSSVGVKIRLSNIPEGPCAAYVLKTDMTSRCATRPHMGHCEIVGDDVEDQIIPVTSESTELIFSDIHAKPNRIYRYQCVMIYPSGRKVVGKVDVLHEHIVDFEQDNIALAIGQPTVTMDDSGSATISFETNVAFTEEGYSQILSLLDQAGVSQDFQKEIGENRGKLDSMIALQIERQDNISGETESFSVQQTGTFVDSRKTRTTAGVMEVVPGRSYRYTCKALMRDPGSLFSDTTQTSVAVDTDRDFQLKVAKFLNPYTLRTGTMPSTQRGLGVSDLSGLVPRNQFLQGRSSIDMSVDVTIPSQRTQITGLTASSTGEFENLVGWTVLGSLDEIDHFIILAEHDGVKSPIGTVHNLSPTGKFEFIDDDLGSEIGTTVYSVIPVFADYTYGAESDGTSVTEAEEYPVFTIGG